MLQSSTWKHFVRWTSYTPTPNLLHVRVVLIRVIIIPSDPNTLSWRAGWSTSGDDRDRSEASTRVLIAHHHSVAGRSNAVGSWDIVHVAGARYSANTVK